MPRVTITALHDASAGTADLIAATRISDRIVTALRDSSGRLKVIAWDIASDGGITRRGDATGGDVGRVAVTDWSDGVVTAVRSADGVLKVIVWKIDNAGNVTRKGDATAGAVSDVAISSPSGFDGVVTAVVNGSGNLELIAWKLSSTGQLTRTDSIGGGTAATLAIKGMNKADNTSRVAVALRNGSGNLEIITWSVTAAGKLARLREAVAGAISDVALAFHSTPNADLLSLTTGSDGQLALIGWVVGDDGSLTRSTTGRGGKASTPSVVAWHPDIHTYAVGAVRSSDDTLKLIVWRNGADLVRYGESVSEAIKKVVVTQWSDGVVTVARDAAGHLKLQSWRLRPAGIRLLRQAWPAASAPAPSPPPPQPAPAARRLTKYGVRAPVPGPPPPPGSGSEPGDDGSSSPAWKQRYFPAVSGVDPMLAVGHQYVIVTQDHSIKFFDRNGVQLPSKAGESTSMSATTFFTQFIAATNPDGTPNANNINLISPLEIKEFYDTRVTYDPQARRFVILSAARQALGTPPPRYIAFAVSRTEDPRDGFYQYMSTESNYRDFPRVVVHDGTVYVAHNAAGLADEGDTPILYAFDLAEMQQFAEEPSNWQYFPSDVDGAVRVFLVLHHGQTNGMTFLVDIRDDSVLRLAAFPKPAQPWLAPEPVFAQHTLGTAAGWPGPFAVFRESALHLSGAKLITDRVPNVQPPRYSVRTVRIPFSGISATQISVDSAEVIDHYFGKNAPTDAANDLVTYDTPHLAVNKNSDVIFVYGRTGVQTAALLPPEVRYSIWYHDEPVQRRSALLQAGSWQPTWNYDASSTDSTPAETTATAITHAYQLDYATAVVDPVDDTTFWVIHEYADGATSGWVTVIGVVDPSLVLRPRSSWTSAVSTNRLRLFRDYFACDLLVGRCRDDLLARQIRLRVIRAAGDDLVGVGIADAGKRHQLVLRRRIEIDQIDRRLGVGRLGVRLGRLGRALRSQR